MQRIIVQIYEVQTPLEAEALIEVDVDHIGSVIVSEENWKLAPLKETIKTIRSSAAKSSLIPLYNTRESVLRTLDYYQPDIVHFCEALSGSDDLWNFCDRLIDLQAFVIKHFPEIKIMRSIPIAQTLTNDRIPTIELAKRFEAASDFFLTDTILMNSSGSEIDRQPVPGFVGITGQICNWETARQLVENTNRITEPLYRAPYSKEWKKVSWDWALMEIAKRVKTTRDATFEPKNAKGQVVNRAAGIASVGSAALDNEECWILQALMRSIGVTYIEHQARI